MTSAENIHRFTKSDIDRRFRATIGRTLGEIDAAGVLKSPSSNKGIAGAIFEQSVLGYPADCRQEPDLIVDGLPTELKVTGLIASPRSKRGWRAKEPMSITAVSPNQIVNEEFYTSTFWDKAERLLLVYYMYVKPGKGIKFAQWATFEVKGYEFHTWSSIDVIRLENDWTIVRDFVKYALDTDKDALLPLLSTNINPQLLLLDTAPKYPHPPRFRFKNSFVNTIACDYFDGVREAGAPVESMQDLDAMLANYAERNGGKTIRDLARELEITGVNGDGSSVPKSITEQILVRMFTGRPGKINSIEVFAKASIEFKSIILTSKGGRTEDMKLEPTIDFDELLSLQTVFSDSIFASRFIDSSIVCAVFQEPYPSCSMLDVTFCGFKRLWLGELVDEAEKLWNSMRALVFEGRLQNVPVLKKDGAPRISPKTKVPVVAPNWPKSKDGTLFVRGTGGDALDKPVEISGVKMYRQNVWIKGTWIVRKLEKQQFLHL